MHVRSEDVCKGVAPAKLWLARGACSEMQWDAEGEVTTAEGEQTGLAQAAGWVNNTIG